MSARLVLGLWEEMTTVQAVKDSRVYYRDSQAYVVAGPRLVTAGVLDDIAAMLAGVAPRALAR